MIPFYVTDVNGDVIASGCAVEPGMIQVTGGVAVMTGVAQHGRNYIDAGEMKVYTPDQAAKRSQPPGPQMRWNPKTMSWVSTAPPAPTPPVATPSPQGH